MFFRVNIHIPIHTKTKFYQFISISVKQKKNNYKMNRKTIVVYANEYFQYFD